MPLLVCEAAGHVPADLVVALPPARAPPTGARGPSSGSAGRRLIVTQRGSQPLEQQGCSKEVSNLIQNICLNNPHHPHLCDVST